MWEKSVDLLREFTVLHARPAVVGDHARQQLVVRPDDELGQLVVVLDAHGQHGDTLSVALFDRPDARDFVKSGMREIRDVAACATAHVSGVRSTQELTE
jgi:hypothetical protein